MDQFIIAMLNTLSQGASAGTTDDLLLNPAAYNATLYQAAVDLHQAAVVPITALVLAIIAVLELGSNAARMDSGDGQMGVRQITVTLIKVAILLTITSQATLLLGGIDEVVTRIANSANGLNVGAGTPTTPLGDQLTDQVESLGITDQLTVLIILLIPWLAVAIISGVVIAMIFVRFLQLYLMTTFASLPMAFWGHQETKSIGTNYVRAYAAIALHGAVLIIAIKLYQASIGARLTQGITVAPDTDVFALVTGNIGQFFLGPLILGLLLFGSVKVSRAVVGEA